MNKFKSVISFILCLIIMLMLFVLQASVFTHKMLFESDYYLSKYENMGLYDYVVKTVESDGKNAAHVTNLPSSLFENLITKEWVKDQFVKGTNQNVQYMLYKSNSLATVDSKAFTESFNIKLDNYIKSNNIVRDSQVDSEIKNVKNNVKGIIDNETTFIGLSTFSNMGSFQSLRHYLNILYSSLAYLIVGIIIFIVMLLLINLKNISKFLYWTGSAVTAGGLFVFIPSLIAYLSGFMNNIAISMKTIKLIAVSIIKDYDMFFIKLSGIIAVSGLLVIVLSIYLERFTNKAKY